MRINAGNHRGAKLLVAKGVDVRPTSDRARQAIFNILFAHGLKIEGAKVLDAFAGSGALGLEALSRGAGCLILFDNADAALDTARRNVAHCREENRTRIVRADATRPPRASGFANYAPADLVFVDPPYGKGLVATTLMALRSAGWIADRAIVVAEMDQRDPFDSPEGYSIREERSYGKAKIIFLEARTD